MPVGLMAERVTQCFHCVPEHTLKITLDCRNVCQQRFYFNKTIGQNIKNTKKNPDTCMQY